MGVRRSMVSKTVIMNVVGVDSKRKACFLVVEVEVDIIGVRGTREELQSLEPLFISFRPSVLFVFVFVEPWDCPLLQLCFLCAPAH